MSRGLTQGKILHIATRALAALNSPNIIYQRRKSHDDLQTSVFDNGALNLVLKGQKKPTSKRKQTNNDKRKKKKQNHDIGTSIRSVTNSPNPTIRTRMVAEKKVIKI